jgi:hypothetical protein
LVSFSCEVVKPVADQVAVACSNGVSPCMQHDVQLVKFLLNERDRS